MDGNPLPGNIGQIAYVDADIEAACTFWARAVGAGPFYVFSHPKVDSARFRGSPIDLDISIALGYWGEMQIEVIQQHDDTLTIYRDAQKRGDKSVNHLGIFVDDLSITQEYARKTGGSVIQEQYIGKDGGVYFDQDGRLIELISLPPGFAEACAMMKAESENWDGLKPVRLFA